jgi:hypothetical protein
MKDIEDCLPFCCASYSVTSTFAVTDGKEMLSLAILMIYQTDFFFSSYTVTQLHH